MEIAYQIKKRGRWNVDVVFEDKKLIIDYFGTIWHMCPLKYDADEYTRGLEDDIRYFAGRNIAITSQLQECKMRSYYLNKTVLKLRSQLLSTGGRLTRSTQSAL